MSRARPGHGWVCCLKGGFGYLERGSSMTGSLLRLVLVLWSRIWAKAGAAALTATPIQRRRPRAAGQRAAVVLVHCPIPCLETRRENDGWKRLVAACSRVCSPNRRVRRRIHRAVCPSFALARDLRTDLPFYTYLKKLD